MLHLSIFLHYYLLYFLLNLFCCLCNICAAIFLSFSYPLLSTIWSYFSAIHSVWGATKEPRNQKSITLSGGEYRCLLCCYHSFPLLTILFHFFLSLNLLIYPHLSLFFYLSPKCTNLHSPSITLSLREYFSFFGYVAISYASKSWEKSTWILCLHSSNIQYL